jgi:hypothetical protein
MIKLSKLISEVIQKTIEANLNESQSIIHKEVLMFLELANPDFAYKYSEDSPNVWTFEDRFGNLIEVSFDPSSRYVESYYIMKDLAGNPVKVYDYERNKDAIDPNSFQGGSDENRSDTICKILRDEIIPKYLISSKPSLIRLHPLNDYRHQIFMKCAELCKEKYPQIEIKPRGKEIELINK